MLNRTYKFELPPLPYAYNALEPFIDTLTMQLHHDRHFKTYIDNLNGVLEKYPEYQCFTLKQLLCGSDCMPEQIGTAVRKNAGGVFNHDFFFANMTDSGQRQPSGILSSEIDRAFGSFDNFKQKFKEAAAGVFGSGYAWLAAGTGRRLMIVTSANQDTPIAAGLFPIMCIDVWEHAYYLKHYNKRGDYIEEWFNVADFKKAEENIKNIFP